MMFLRITKCRVVAQVLASKRVKYGLTLFGHVLIPEFDQLDCEKYKQEYNKAVEQLSGWERVKHAFIREGKETSAEVGIIGDTILMSCLASTVIGGMPAAKKEYHNFIQNNKATIFGNMKAARRQLTDRLIMATLKGSFSVAWRMALFSSIFMASCFSVQAYQNRHSTAGYAASGALTGALYQCRLGFKPMASGALLGGTCGALAGFMVQLMYWSSGITFDDIRYARYLLDKAYLDARASRENKSDEERAPNKAAAATMLSDKMKEVEKMLAAEEHRNEEPDETPSSYSEKV